MFCSNCGKEATGKFCWSCGAALEAGAGLESVELVEAAVDWTETLDYETLLKVPAVRERIARHAAQAKQRMSAEDFLENCEKVFAPLMGGLPVASLTAKVMHPLYIKWGIQMRKARSETIFKRPGEVLVGVLCSLAAQGHELRKATHTEDGCVLEATIASDMWSFAGDLIVTVKPQGQATVVEAAAVVKGQKFDWGKSRRCLDRLFDDLVNLPAAA
jgi:hypothetical protein